MELDYGLSLNIDAVRDGSGFFLLLSQFSYPVNLEPIWRTTFQLRDRESVRALRHSTQWLLRITLPTGSMTYPRSAIRLAPPQCASYPFLQCRARLAQVHGRSSIAQEGERQRC
jgi:hypothetical protein